MNMIAVGIYLKELRVMQALSQHQLAERIGVAGNTIWRIEAGKQEPKTEQIVNLLAVLHGSADDVAVLMREGDADRARTMAVMQFTKAADRASADRRREIADELRRIAESLDPANQQP